MQKMLFVRHPYTAPSICAHVGLKIMPIYREKKVYVAYFQPAVHNIIIYSHPTIFNRDQDLQCLDDPQKLW